MKQILLTAFFLCFIHISNSQKKNILITVFEKSQGAETATYDQTIDFYLNLATSYSEISVQEIGETDSGKPLHLVILNSNAEFDFTKIRKNKRILLINNGIHPGESDGIDATMLLFRDIANGKIAMPKNTVIVTIPIYNVGGSLNRNTSTRTNQNGPKAYGFRGNARNYDLNRDFIKCDTKNAKTFTQIFQLVQPDVFIDTHVSNGADYQYTLTHLFTQHNKLGGHLGTYLHKSLMPELEKKLTKKKWDITPYVNVFNSVPEKGFSQFLDYPRYSTGYTTLFNTLGMMIETHMLKPYKQRVIGTYEMLKTMIEIIEVDTDKIKELRSNAYKNILQHKTYPLDWSIDTSKTTTLHFKGFEGKMITSKITGAQRLKYFRDKPFTKEIIYQNYFKPKLEISIPTAYIIPQGWHNIIELLKLNQVETKVLQQDTIIHVEAYKIIDYKTRTLTYEGHYQHFNTSVGLTKKEMSFRKGDFLIYTDQPAIRYLLETLEPQAPDSFFNWNFFDTVLQQKEGFSPYVWEDLAKELLDNNPSIKHKFTTKKETDIEFANNWYAQLQWLHQQSKYYEKAHLEYPVYRVM